MFCMTGAQADQKRPELTSTEETRPNQLPGTAANDLEPTPETDDNKPAEIFAAPTLAALKPLRLDAAITSQSATPKTSGQALAWSLVRSPQKRSGLTEPPRISSLKPSTQFQKATATKE